MKPEINVTPLIDVLLVLLIIFMVISPLKHSKFETRIPAESQGGPPSDLTLVAKINKDSTLSLNGFNQMGTIDDPAPLIQKLTQVFADRTRNNVINHSIKELPNSKGSDRVEKTVFIKAPRSISYGEVVKVIDVVKGVGANPISLQIDDLD